MFLQLMIFSLFQHMDGTFAAVNFCTYTYAEHFFYFCRCPYTEKSH